MVERRWYSSACCGSSLPAMRLMLNARSSAVKSRPFAGGLLWILTPGLTCSTYSEPSPGISHFSTVAGVSFLVLPSSTRARFPITCQIEAASAVCISACLYCELLVVPKVSVPPCLGCAADVGATVGLPAVVAARVAAVLAGFVLLLFELLQAARRRPAPVAAPACSARRRERLPVSTPDQ